MTFTSVIFLAFVLVSALLYDSFQRTAYRKAVLLVASLIFLFSYAGAAQALLPLAAFILAGYAAVIMARQYPRGHVPGVLIAVFVALFLWLKRYPFVAFLPGLTFVYLMVGASYILFRTLHLVIDVRDGRLNAPSFGDYLIYNLFFPSLLSGPINRYEDFRDDLQAPRPVSNEESIGLLWRWIIGFAKVACFGELVHMAQISCATSLRGMLSAGAAPGLAASVYFITAAALYFVYLYLNFSGYMDIAISIARLFGIALPENFNKPFRAANFQDLWSRWHITLSNWFKVYFYNPLLKAMFHRWTSRALTPYLGIVASFVVFLTLGAWHGASWEFMIIGLSLALGVSVNMLYQVEMTKRLGKRSYQALARREAYALLSRGFTMAYFSFTLCPIWLSVAEMARLAAVAGLPKILAASILLSLSFSLAFAFWDHVVLKVAARIFIWRLEGRVPRIAALGFCVFALAMVVPAINSPPEFVYKAF